ncbi:MAG: hypothetical protein JNJ57_14455 [Saprospiraceae bacterium]|nr:hypothetical protein [Saprospiraceae bacterium]
MKLLFTILLAFFMYALQSQTIERWEYCQVSFQANGFNSKTKIKYDFGDRVSKGTDRDESLKDSTGTTLKFKSPVDVLNYLGEMGWECFSKEEKNPLDYTGVLNDVYYFKRRKR